MEASTTSAFLEGMARIHAGLRRSLDTIVRVSSQPIAESDRAGFADFCGRFTRLLRTHHEGEEEIVFPKIVEGARRASLATYATHVGEWRADHERLLVHLSELEAAVAQFPHDGQHDRLQRTAHNLRDVMTPHLDAEEAVLNDASFNNVLRPDEVVDMILEAGKHGQRVGGPRVLMMLVHSFTNEEQKAHFSKMPWFVRKLLLKRIWARGFQGCLKYAHNPSIAL